ncbi:DNA cytosine methyltransferase [Listeria monocytogenes]|nr:DNA (cytosine-5-)-methyltransferase [Listeria monocytogenes]EAE1498762.1 DNA (cytosine-5-)-methyltransferase [Listeria monocytogenes]HDI3721977.1 DNA (cytosine-5-)-methyltransferase [Listeria monocytogenes]HDU3385676.1 DNA (cytosine-5-)-methyltransferase [Listeria monocytogenes]
MKFLDLFAGVGGFRLGMESAGHECVGFVEIDKYARKSYKAIHETEGEFEGHDITTITDDTVRSIGSVDVICGGFPCQAFSIAGKRRGFQDTRGTLFFEIARFASILRPRLLFLENVKGLLNHNNGDTFETILGALDELGYDVEWQVFNSKHFGVPQNRERVFIIGHSRTERTRKVFPFGAENETTSVEQPRQIILGTTKNPEAKGRNQRHDTFSTDGIMGCLTATDYKQPKQIAIPVLTPDRLEKRQNGRRFKEDGEEMFTITAQDRHGIMIAGSLPGNHDQNSRLYSTEGLAPTLSTMQGGGQEPKILVKESTAQGYAEAYRIRKLTPRECWRLQGFPDWAFDRAAEVNSDSQLYKQAGNSVTVNVIAAIAKRLEEPK